MLSETLKSGQNILLRQSKPEMTSKKYEKNPAGVMQCYSTKHCNILLEEIPSIFLQFI
jgi:hypothetical protein